MGIERRFDRKIGKSKGAVMQKLGWMILVCVVVAWGCAQADRERLKHFFFEIPEPAEAAADAEETPAPAEKPVVLVGAKSAYRSVHSPYVDRECLTCHDSTKRMGVHEDLLEACASCHERFFDEDELGHLPAMDGECRECHVLHRSERPSLLKAPVFDLCAECHDPDDLDEDICGTDLQNCTKCHDAHFGESPLLKPGVEAAED